MSAHRIVTARGCELHECDHGTLAAQLVGQQVDALIVDAPYSARTHAGHDDGTVDANRATDLRARLATRGRRIKDGNGSRVPSPSDSAPRRSIDYAAWSPADVAAFVAAWAPLTRGWFVSITDHVLAAAWADELATAGRYVFAPLPLYSPGSRVRLSGDGPSSWTCWIVAARPSNREFFQWGTLPGGYHCAPEKMPVVGGKPMSAMRAIVRDYTRPGNVVCDPCFGGATTALACALEGRSFIGSEPMQSHFDIGVERLSSVPLDNARTGQMALLGRAS